MRDLIQSFVPELLFLRGGQIIEFFLIDLGLLFLSFLLFGVLFPFSLGFGFGPIRVLGSPELDILFLFKCLTFRWNIVFRVKDVIALLAWAFVQQLLRQRHTATGVIIRVIASNEGVRVPGYLVVLVLLCQLYGFLLLGQFLFVGLALGLVGIMLKFGNVFSIS